MWGTAKSSFLLHARGIEHHSNGVQNVLGAINLVLASGRIGKPKFCGYGTITGQANGQGGREHGQKCDQLPGWRDISNPEHAPKYIAGVWGMPNASCRGRASTPTRCSARSTRRDQGAALDLLQPKVSLPDNDFVRARSRSSSSTSRSTSSSTTPRATPTSCCPARCRKRTRAPSRRPRGASSRSTRRSSAPARRGRTGASSRTSRRRSAASTASPSPARARSSRSCASPARAASPTTPASPTRRSSADGRLLALPDPKDARPPRHAAAVRAGSWNPVAKGAGPFYFPDGKARFNVAAYRRPPTTSEEYPLFLTTGRVVSQFLSGTQTRRIGPLVEQYPEPRIELHPRLAEKLGIADGAWATARPGAARSRCARWW
jgi:assimilatory nitrate reductase catalytic subunit